MLLAVLAAVLTSTTMALPVVAVVATYLHVVRERRLMSLRVRPARTAVVLVARQVTEAPKITGLLMVPSAWLQHQARATHRVRPQVHNVCQT